MKRKLLNTPFITQEHTNSQKLNIMYIEKEIVVSLNTSQVAYPVGKNKDSYSIHTWFREDLKTGKITSKHELVKNSSYSPKDVNKNYPEGAKHRVLLHIGTYQECITIVSDIVLKEGEWRQIPNDPFNKELVFTID